MLDTYNDHLDGYSGLWPPCECLCNTGFQCSDSGDSCEGNKLCIADALSAYPSSF